MADEPQPILQRCRTANCPNRQVGPLCKEHDPAQRTAKRSPSKPAESKSEAKS